MKRRILITLLIGIAAMGLGFTATEKQPLAVTAIAKAMDSVVLVRGDRVIGSGFYIGNGIIVTAGHVSQNKSFKYVMFEDGIKYDILSKHTHPDYDCGFLIIEKMDRPALKFDTKPNLRGQPRFVLGNPSGLTFISTAGIVTGKDTDTLFGDTSLCVVDAVTHPGNSGSAVIDLDAEVRGVHVGGKVSRCGSSLHGYEVNVQAVDILKALDAAGLEI